MKELMKAKAKFSRKYKNEILAATLLFIPLLWWVLFGLFPIIFGMALGFMEWKGFNDPPKFVFMDNFIMFFKNPFYYMALIRSFTIGGLCFIAGLLSSLFVAAVVNRMTKLKTFFRSVWYVPCVLSPVVATMIVNIFLDPTNGMLNNVLMEFGLEPIAWKSSTGWSVFWIVIYSTWKSLGGSVILWLAAFQSVDKSLNEAAALDGATRRQTFWKIELPQMVPIIVYILITGFGSMMQIYEQVLFITNGGPYGTTEVLAYRIMRDAFWDHNFGMAGASSVIMMLVTFGFILIVFRKQKESVK